MSVPIVMVGLFSWHHGKLRIFPYRVAAVSPHAWSKPFPFNWSSLEKPPTL